MPKSSQPRRDLHVEQPTASLNLLTGGVSVALGILKVGTDIMIDNGVKENTSDMAFPTKDTVTSGPVVFTAV